MAIAASLLLAFDAAGSVSSWSADDAHVVVDAKTGYPAAFRGNYSGEFEPLKFEGDFGIQIDLTDTNASTTVTLPSLCNKPISQ